MVERFITLRPFIDDCFEVYADMMPDEDNFKTLKALQTVLHPLFLMTKVLFILI